MAEDKEPESTDTSTPAAGDQSDPSDPTIDPTVDPIEVDEPGLAASDEALETTDDTVDGEGDDGEADDTADAADDPDTDAADEADSTDDPEPALVGAAAKPSEQSKDLKKTDKTKTETNGSNEQTTTKTAARTTTKASGSKGRATPKQRRTVERERRTGPVKFASESVGELRKVVYPTASQLRTYFVVVLVFVLFVIAYVSVLDLGFGWLILRVFG